MFKFYLNNIELTEQPEGWQDLSTTIRLDKELKGLFKMMDVSLTFYKDGYDTIYNAYETNGHCYSLPFDIKQNSGTDTNAYYTIFSGTLFFKDLEFTEGIEGNSVKVKIEDNSFFAKINSNKSLKSKIYTGLSKNGETITIPTHYKITYFTPSTGVYFAIVGGAGNERNYTGFKVFDVLQYFIEFMSDGDVDFYSDTFGTGGTYEDYLLTTGYFIRTVKDIALGTGIDQDLFEYNWPELSFSDVFRELDKQFNIAFVAGFDGNRPYIRIEELAYFKRSNVIYSCENVDKLTRRPASEYLYASVRVGSDTTLVDDAGLQFPEKIRAVGFYEEEYYVAGECNIDKVLNLVNTAIISSNVIEELVVNESDAYDDQLVIVHCEYVSGTRYDAVQSNWILGTGTPWYYNEQLNNTNKLIRHQNGLPNDLVQQLAATTDNTFSADNPTGYNSINGVVQTLIPFAASNVVTDPSGNYDFLGYQYIIPETGIYTFRSITQWLVTPAVVPATFTTPVNIDVYLVNTATGAEMQIASRHYSQFGNYALIVNASGTINASQTDAIQLKIVFSGFYTAVPSPHGSNVQLYPGGTFECISAEDGGGTFLSVDANDYPVMRNTFETPMTLEDFRTIDADARGLIDFSTALVTQQARNQNTVKVYRGELEELKYSHNTGIAKITALSTDVTII